MNSLIGSLFVLLQVFLNIYSFQCPSGSDQVPNEEVCMFSVTQEANGLAPYIGVERKQNNTWTYADGSTLGYQNWALNEPNNASNTTVCAIMDPQNGKWLSAECTFARPFICSIDGEAFQCPTGWRYNAKTDYCYFLQNFTYPDGSHWLLYNVSAAEANCQRLDSHLVSIHSQVENDFVSDLVASNVALLKGVAPNNENPCGYQWAWIGYYGNTTIREGTWTDGSPVDWTPPNWQPPQDFFWVIGNDASCGVGSWGWTNMYLAYSRIVCKMPSKNRIALQKRNF